jgi:hypothetical protein
MTAVEFEKHGIRNGRNRESLWADLKVLQEHILRKTDCQQGDSITFLMKKLIRSINCGPRRNRPTSAFRCGTGRPLRWGNVLRAGA